MKVTGKRLIHLANKMPLYTDGEYVTNNQWLVRYRGKMQDCQVSRKDNIFEIFRKVESAVPLTIVEDESGTCPKCSGTGQATCSECGQKCVCKHCAGIGVTMKALRTYARPDGTMVQCRVAFALLFGDMPVVQPAHDPLGPLCCRDGRGWYAAIMPVRP